MYSLERYTLPELIEKSSVRYAERPALSMVGGEAVSYAELEPRTRRVAAFLGLLGARKGDRAALISENCPEWGIAFFGIERAGCVAVPILTDFTPEQMGNILAHSESRFVFVSKRFAAKLGAAPGGAHAGPLAGRTIVSVESLELLGAPAGATRPSTAELDAATAAFASPEVGADDVASVVYTSGTTGLSKGVMLTHRNLLSNAEGCRRFIMIRRTDRFLSILPLAHTYEFTIGFIIPILAGSSVYYLDRPPSTTVLLPALKAIRPTIFLSVPLLIEKIYRASVKPALEKIALYKYPILRAPLERIASLKLLRTLGGKIRFFGIGGAPLASDVETFLNRTHFPYSIGYGLTETAPLLTGSRPGHVKLRAGGDPTTGVELRIADPRPDTGEGEIQARGPNVTPGYFRDPERTKEIFTADGWFKTGDLGVMDARGRVAVRGRIKTMILGASGENIYPEEVEAVLNSSPYVAESLVYGDESGLTALVQLKPETLEELAARFKDKIEEAEGAATRLGEAVGAAIGRAEEKIAAAEKSAEALLEGIKREANARLAAFSRLAVVKIQAEPFEKTPTQKIKRFLYPRKNTTTAK
jgi:long-chain acyl-CoA synthetase